MSFRFWRRVQFFPGVSVSLNLSKSGASLSVRMPV